MSHYSGSSSRTSSTRLSSMSRASSSTHSMVPTCASSCTSNSRCHEWEFVRIRDNKGNVMERVRCRGCYCSRDDAPQYENHYPGFASTVVSSSSRGSSRAPPSSYKGMALTTNNLQRSNSSSHAGSRTGSSIGGSGVSGSHSSSHSRARSGSVSGSSDAYSTLRSVGPSDSISNVSSRVSGSRAGSQASRAMSGYSSLSRAQSIGSGYNTRREMTPEYLRQGPNADYQLRVPPTDISRSRSRAGSVLGGSVASSKRPGGSTYSKSSSRY